MNKYKYRHKPVHKFDRPIRKNSADFNDSDIDIEPEFSLNNSINYDNGILINLDNNDETLKNDIFLNKNSSHSLDKHYNEEMNYDIKEKISKEKEDEKEKANKKRKQIMNYIVMLKSLKKKRKVVNKVIALNIIKKLRRSKKKKKNKKRRKKKKRKKTKK